MSRPLTYSPVGITRGTAPEGFRTLRVRRVVGRGPRDFEAAAGALRSWEAQRVPGVRVEPPDAPVSVDSEIRVRLGVGRLALSAPARVVYVLDAPGRQGFAYGTLEGHPLAGEEAFVVDLEPDGRVAFTVAACSRPGSPLTRLAGPVLPVFQRLMAALYLRAVARAVRRAR